MKIGIAELAATGVFTAFVAASTMVVSAYVAATGGYFNVGEIMVYTAALLMGPVVGGFAGGVGSAIADVALGYTVFAPGTLVIKGVEGLIVGYLARRRFKPASRGYLKALSVAAGFTLALLVWWGGVSYFTGDLEFTFGVAPATTTLTAYVPEVFWTALAALSFILVSAIGFTLEPRVGWLVIAVLIGGGEMVLGYYIYESYILGQVLALVEVLVNVGQVMVGLLVALPLSRSIEKVLHVRQRAQAAEFM